MRLMENHNKIRRFAGLALLIAVFPVLVFIYQNCSNPRLTGFSSKRSSSLTGHAVSRLPAPIIAPGKMRVMFFLDQSHSMIRARCPGDLDNPDKGQISNTGDTSNCPYEVGVDSDGDRFAALEIWLDELSRIEKGQEDSDQVKVSIIPFSGGKYHRKSDLWGDTDEDFGFKTVRDARVWLEKLHQEHNTDLASAQANGDPLRMGTTVPLPTLNYASGVFTTEMQKIKAQDPNILKMTPFHFVYLSDGVFKPLDGYLKTALEIVGCADCSQNPTDPSCTPGQICTGGPCAYELCKYTIPNEFTKAFGQSADNKTDKIAADLQNLLDLQSLYETGGINLHLVKIHPERIKDEDKDDPITAGVKSIFDAIQKKVPKAKAYDLRGPQPPFSFGGGGGAFLSYRLEAFYVVNLNVFVNALGQVVTDSDGDGLPDREEGALQFNPAEYRSGSAACNDGITKNYGCTFATCEPNVDVDGDGLGDCEEASFKSDPKRVNKTRDGVLDIFKSVRNLNPNISVADQYTAGDGSSDLQHFFAGVDPHWVLSKVSGKDLINVKVDEAGYDVVTATDGTKMALAKYSIWVNNVPLRKTIAATGTPQLFRLKDPPQAIPLNQMVGPTDHGAGINQVVIIAKGVAAENPELQYWLLYRMDVPNGRDGDTFTFDVDLSKFVQLDLKN